MNGEGRARKPEARELETVSVFSDPDDVDRLRATLASQ